MKLKQKKIIAILLAVICTMTICFSGNIVEAGDYTDYTFTFTTDGGETYTIKCNNDNHPAVGTNVSRDNIIFMCSSSNIEAAGIASPFNWSPNEVAPITWTETNGPEKMRDVYFSYFHGSKPVASDEIIANMNLNDDLTRAKLNKSDYTRTIETAPEASSFTYTVSGAQTNNGATQTSPVYTLNTGSSYYYTKVTAPPGVTINYYYPNKWQTASGTVNVPNGTKVYFTAPNALSRKDTISFNAVLSDGSTAYYIDNVKLLTSDRQLSDINGKNSYNVQQMSFPEVSTPGYTVSVDWQPVYGSIKLTKRSGCTSVSGTSNNSSYSLAGAVYGVYASPANATTDTNRVGTITIGDDGTGSLGNLTIGSTYFVKEIIAPAGYTLDVNVYPAAINSTTPVEITSTDNPSYDPVNILLTKNDEDGIRIKGAVFEIKYYRKQTDSLAGLAGETPESTWRLVTNANGQVELLDSYRATASNANWKYDAAYADAGQAFYRNINGKEVLPLGTITIQELDAPEGYEVDTTVYVRKVEANGGMLEVNTYNAPTVTESETLGRIKLHKVGKYGYYDDNDRRMEDTLDLENVEFAIYAAEEIKTPAGTHKYDEGELVTTMTTDADGNAVSDKLYLGKYKVVEISSQANELYDLAEPVFVTLDTEDVKDVTEGTVSESIEVVNKSKTPSLKTKAWDKDTKTNMASNKETLKLVDTTSYSNLVAGSDDYELETKIMLFDTGEELMDRDGDTFSKKTVFIPASSDGSIDVEIEVPRNLVEGQAIVFFEILRKDGKIVTFHKSLTDEDQRIAVYYPKIITNAICRETGSHTGVKDGIVTIVDNTKITDIIKGNRYYVEGVLINKATMQPVLDKNNKEYRIKSEVFTADSDTKILDMVYSGPAEDFNGYEVVVYEYLYIVDAEGTSSLIAQECDLSNSEQTVAFPEQPKTGDNAKLSLFGITGMTALIGCIVVIIVRRRKRNGMD